MPLAELSAAGLSAKREPFYSSVIIKHNFLKQRLTRFSNGTALNEAIKKTI
jgi:hypothetical protein